MDRQPPFPMHSITLLGTPRRFASHLSAAAVAVTCALALPAQTVAPAAPAASGGGETVELSPFTVAADRDVGYVATSSLAGSRLNSDLRDTPIALSVMTAEFLRDLGANNVNEAIEFATNAENDRKDGTGNGYESSAFAYSVRGYGSTVARNYFRFAVLADSYALERLDIARGPNALLSGIGSPGGFINSTTKTARLDRDAARIELQVGEWDHRRASLDVSRTLIPQRLALRLNAVAQDAGSWREWGFEDRKGLHLAATFKPFAQTAVRAEAERGDVKQVRPRPWTGINWYGGWQAAGSPLSLAWGVRPPGSNADSATNLTAEYGNVIAPQLPYGTRAVNLQNFWLSNSPRQGILSNPMNIRDESVHPFSANIQGPGARQNWDYKVLGVFVEQAIGRNLTIEGAYYYQAEDRLSGRPIAFGDIGLRVDLNTQIPVFNAAGVQTGTQPNPNLGRYVTRHWYNEDTYARESNDYRLSASYSLELGKLGSHRLAAMYQFAERTQDQVSRREANLSPTRRNPNLGNTANRVWRLTYLDLVRGSRLERGAHDFREYPGEPGPILGAANFGFASGLYDAAANRSLSEVSSFIGALQSFFFNRRLVTTVGLRRDHVVEYGSTQTLDPVTAAVREVRLNGTPSLDSWKTTTSAGLVFHLTPKLSVFANASEAFVPQVGQSAFGEIANPRPVGNITGEGRDVGLRFTLPENRLSVSLAYYFTNQDNARTFWSGAWVDAPITAIWDALDIDRTISAPTNADVLSQEVDGFEFEAVANPVRNLRVSFNATKSNLITRNRFPNMINYVAANRDQWLSAGSQPMLVPTYGATIRDAVAYIDTIVERENNFWGRSPQKQRDWTANLFLRYDLPLQRLRGLYVGGGANYRGPMTVGYELDGRRLTGFDQTTVSALLGYAGKVRKTRFTIQLNVDNALNNDDWYPVNVEYRAADRAFEYNMQMPDPRRWRLTASIAY